MLDTEVQEGMCCKTHTKERSFKTLNQSILKEAMEVEATAYTPTASHPVSHWNFSPIE